MANHIFGNNGANGVAADVMYVGVDACPGGWFSIGFTGAGQYVFHVSQGFVGIVEHYPAAELILVDIPIGLPVPNMPRQCEGAARGCLGQPRASSVFPAPLREIVEFVDNGNGYTQANALNRQLVGRGLSRQSYSLIPKILEVDGVFANQGQNINPLIREVHPEVCFWALNHRNSMAHSKKDLAGILERMRVMAGVGFDTRDMLDVAHQYIPARVGCDDFCDALVAAITAFQGHNQLGVLGQIDGLDEMGLAMEMVYWEP